MIVRYTDFVDEIKKCGKRKNTTFTEKEKAYLTDFLKDCYLPTGLIVASVHERTSKGLEYNFTNTSFSFDKIEPKRDTTATLADALLNISSLGYANVYLKTGTFFYDKTGEYPAAKMYASKIMAVDIDNCSEIYDLKTIEEKKIYLKNRYPIMRTLLPTYIIETGNKGVQLIYVFEDNVFDKTGTYNFLNKCLGFFFDADMQRTNLYNSIRMPFSTNQKSGRQARIIGKGVHYSYKQFKKKLLSYADNHYIDFDGNVYSNKQIADQYELPYKWDDDFDETVGRLMCESVLKDTVRNFITERYGYPSAPSENYRHVYIDRHYRKVKSKAHKATTKKKKDRGQIKRFKQIRNDLEEFLDENEGYITGYRNNFIYIMSVTLRYLGYSPDACLKECCFYSKKFHEPLPLQEIKSKVKYAYKKNVRISNYDIRNLLNLSQNIMDRSSNWYNNEEKETAVKRRNKATNEKRRKDRNFATRRKEKLEIVLKGILKGHSAALIAKESGYNRKYIYQLIQKYGFLKYALQLGEKTAKKTLRSITVAKKKGKALGQRFIIAHTSANSLAFVNLNRLSDFWHLHIDVCGAGGCSFIDLRSYTPTTLGRTASA